MMGLRGHAYEDVMISFLRMLIFLFLCSYNLFKKGAILTRKWFFPNIVFLIDSFHMVYILMYFYFFLQIFILYLCGSRFETILFKLEVLDHKTRERAGVITSTFGGPIPVLLQLDAAVEVIHFNILWTFYFLFARLLWDQM